MIPLKDNIPSRRFPIINYGLIGLNGLLFLVELTRGRELDAFLYRFGLVPAELVSAFRSEPAALPGVLIALVTSMFLHGGWLHVLGNMLYLYIFGDNVEDRLGHARYLLFYLAVGVAAGLGHVATNVSSGVPTIGASGAVAGVMGAYMLLYPRARVLTLIPLFIFIEIVPLPAVAYLLFWFVLQFLQGSAALAGQHGAGVAWWAHITGFAAGAGCVLVLGLRRGRKPYTPTHMKRWGR